MKAIINFLNFLCENWMLILAVFMAIGGILIKTRKWLSMSNDAKRKAAIEAVRRSMLALVTAAEQAYGSGTGLIKRSQVLEKIFTQYPVLADAVNITETTVMLDEMIDEALVDLRELFESNEKFYDIINNTLTLTGEELEVQFGVPVAGEPEEE